MIHCVSSSNPNQPRLPQLDPNRGAKKKFRVTKHASRYSISHRVLLYRSPGRIAIHNPVLIWPMAGVESQSSVRKAKGLDAQIQTGCTRNYLTRRNPHHQRRKKNPHIGRSVPATMDAAGESPGAISIRYIAHKAEHKTEPGSESKTDTVTVHKTDTIVDAPLRSKIEEEGDNDDILSDLFGSSDDEEGTAPIARNCQHPELIQPNESTRIHCEKERAGEMEYPPPPVRPHTLLGDLFGGVTEQNGFSRRPNDPSHAWWNVEGCAESQPTRRVALSPHTQVVIPEGP